MLGTLAAFALTRYRRFFGRTLFAGMVAAPLVMPEVIIGLSLLLMLVSLQRATEAWFGVGFPERGMLTIWLGHLLLGMAYATVVVRARLQTLNPQLEEAAMDLGARPWQVFWLVTLPMISQALLSAFLLTFTLSLDDVVLSAFLSGPGCDDDAAGHLLARPARPQPERQRRGDDHHHAGRRSAWSRQLRPGAQRAPPRPGRWPRRNRGPVGRERSGSPTSASPLAMAIVGAYVGFSKALVVIFPVFLLAWLRFAIAAVAMAPWLRRPADEAPLDARTHRLLFLESFFGNFLFSICMLAGIYRSSALAAGVIMAAIPAVVAILSWVLLGERAGLAGDARHRLRDRRHRAGRASRATPTASSPAARSSAPCCCSARSSARRSTSSSARSFPARVGPKRISALINLWGLALVTPLALWQLPGFAWNFIPAVVVGPARRLRDLRQRADGVAVDDRPEARAGLLGRRVHRVPADQRRGGRRDVPRRAVHARRRRPRSRSRWSAWCSRAGARARPRAALSDAGAAPSACAPA